MPRRAPIPPTAVVISGTRKLMHAQFPFVDQILGNLKANIFITGGCEGVDTYACCELVRSRPTARHIVVIPYGYKWNVGHHKWAEEHGCEVLDMPKPPRGEKRHPNLLRNDYMLELARELTGERAKLVAFPGGPTEVQRSGTWATIREAGKQQMAFSIYPLSTAPASRQSGVWVV
jgi:hypothetical protein